MTRPPMRTALILAALALVWSGGGRTCCAAEARSVQELMKQQSSWPIFVHGQLQLTVEGRYTSVSSNRLGMRECDLPFLPEKGSTLPKLTGRSTNVEVSGILEKRPRGYVFIVKRIRETAADTDTYRQKRAQLDLDDPQEWYELGDWAAERGKFYSDGELLALAKESYAKGISAEYRNVAPDDHQGLMTLAKKVKEHGLPASLEQEYIHEALQRRWAAVREQSPEEIRKFAEEIAELLAGSDEPLSPPQPKLRTRYWDNPRAVYTKSGNEERRKLHRVFVSTVLLESIVRQADPDGSNGFEIAALIDEVVPERHDLAVRYRDETLELRFSRVETGTRQEAIELSEEFRKRQRPEKARATLERWVAAKERQLRQEGPSGLMQVAKDYTNLLEDQEAAAELLIEAHQMSPDTEEIVQELNRLGYHHKDGRWVTGIDGELEPVDPIRKAMREGQVVVGMTPAQVRKSLGEPNSVTRVASASELNEVWAYRTAGGSRLVVHFIRNVPRNECAVVSISQFKAR